MREARSTILLCRCAQTSTPAETEYAALLAEAVQGLLSAVQRLIIITTGSVEEVPWFKNARLLVSQLNARLDPDDGSHGEPCTEAWAVKWQLTSDEVTHFVRRFDDLELTQLGFYYRLVPAMTWTWCRPCWRCQ